MVLPPPPPPPMMRMMPPPPPQPPRQTGFDVLPQTPGSTADEQSLALEIAKRMADAFSAAAAPLQQQLIFRSLTKPPAPPAVQKSPAQAAREPRDASDACAGFGTLMEMCSELEARDRYLAVEAQRGACAERDGRAAAQTRDPNPERRPEEGAQHDAWSGVDGDAPNDRLRGGRQSAARERQQPSVEGVDRMLARGGAAGRLPSRGPLHSVVPGILDGRVEAVVEGGEAHRGARGQHKGKVLRGHP
jgi:hypothetical protein